MNEKRYLVGEIATITGLTVRTLQHYDNIGLLPVSGRTEGGRRFYTESDLVRLEQIIFYKMLDFTLEEIKETLMDSSSLSELEDILKNQEFLLLRKIEQLHTSYTTIDVCMKMINAGKKPPFHVLLKFIKTLPGDDVFEWGPSMLSQEQQSIMSESFKDPEDVQRFLHKLKAMLIGATALLNSGFSPAHEQAQILAEQWMDMILSISDGNSKALEQFIQIGKASESKQKGEKQLMDDAYSYIQQVCAIYTANHNLPNINQMKCGTQNKT